MKKNTAIGLVLAVLFFCTALSCIVVWGPKSVRLSFDNGQYYTDLSKDSTGRLKVCPNILLLGCSYVPSYKIDTLRSDPSVFTALYGFSTASRGPDTTTIVGWIGGGVIILLLIYLLWDMFRPRRPMTAEERKALSQDMADEAKALEILDRRLSIREKLKKEGDPFWWLH